MNDQIEKDDDRMEVMLWLQSEAMPEKPLSIEEKYEEEIKIQQLIDEIMNEPEDDNDTELPW